MTWALVVAAGVLFAFIYFVERPIRREQTREISRKVFDNFQPAKINDILIRSAGGLDIRATQTNQAWQLTQPIFYPASSGAIEALLAGLEKLEWQTRITSDELKDRPDAQEKFGLARPQFSLVLQGAGENRRLLVGDTTPLGDQVYLQIVGNDSIYVADVGLLKLLPHEKNEWRDPSVLNLVGMAFRTLKVRSAAKGFDLDRDPATRLWSMKTPLQARADSGKINQLLRDLQALRVAAYVSDDPKTDPEPFGLQSSPQTPELELSFLRRPMSWPHWTLETSLAMRPILPLRVAFSRAILSCWRAHPSRRGWGLIRIFWTGISSASRRAWWTQSMLAAMINLPFVN